MLIIRKNINLEHKSNKIFELKPQKKRFNKISFFCIKKPSEKSDGFNIKIYKFSF